MESSKCCREELCCHLTPWARPLPCPSSTPAPGNGKESSCYHLHLCGLPASTVSLEIRIGPGSWARKEKIQPHKAWQLRTIPEASRTQAKQHSWGAAGSWPQPLGTQRSYILTPTS